MSPVYKSPVKFRWKQVIQLITSTTIDSPEQSAASILLQQTDSSSILYYVIDQIWTWTSVTVKLQIEYFALHFVLRIIVSLS